MRRPPPHEGNASFLDFPAVFLQRSKPTVGRRAAQLKENNMRFQRNLGLAILFLVAFSAAALSAPPPTAPLDQNVREHLTQTLLGLPLRFEANEGSSDAAVKYLARGPGYTLFLTPGETVLLVRKKQPRAVRGGETINREKKEGGANIVRVRLEGANREAGLRGEGAFSVPTNYFIGNDPSKWRTATNYERVRCESVYPGVDLLYHGKQHELEYDFEVAPGADPKRIALRYRGVRRLRVDADGSLVLRLRDGGELRQHKPVAYQTIAGERREVASRFLVKGNTSVAFALGDYDASQALVIDPPVLSYSTYVGGSGNDNGNGIAVDAAGNVYIAGDTASTNFPTLNQYQTDQTNTDAFVTKLNPNATGAASLLYSTYLGGGDIDIANGIAVDSSGNAFVVGLTQSTNFPTLNQFQTDQGLTDAFVTKLDTNASGVGSLLYSTYLGGTGNDIGMAIAVGGAGNVLVTGDTSSADFPLLNQYQIRQGPPTGFDVFVTKLDPTLSGAASLIYSTYLGAPNAEDHGTGIAVGANGKAFVTGWTGTNGGFPILNQYQTHQTGFDAFFTKLDPSLSGVASLLYSTYLGGSSDDFAYAIAVDSAGVAYVTGTTGSSNFPTLNQYQTNQAFSDVFVTKFDPTLSGVASLLYSTYLGGNFNDFGNGIAVDSAGNAFVAGETDSSDLPTLDPLQTDQTDTDAFVAKLNTNASGVASLLFSTYLGGNGVDKGKGIAIDAAGRIYVTGGTASTDFPTLNQYQTNQGTDDCFVTKYGPPPPSNDNCAGAIAVALDTVVSGTTLEATNDYELSGAACFTGIGQTAAGAVGRDVVYSFTAPAANNYSFRISNYSGGGDPVLYVASTCPAATPGTPAIVSTCLGAANRSNASAGAFTSEEVSCLALSAGQQVFIFVDEQSPTVGSDFTLEVNLCPLETEPNNTPATAAAFATGVEGSINPSTDADFFSLGAPPAGSRVFALLDGRAANSTDFDLRVTTATDTLEYDNADADPFFGDLSATIAGRTLSGATSYLRVSTFNTPPATASEPYRLYAVVQPPSATAESEPNGTRALANTAANNYFSGSLSGAAPSTDLDFFRFTVAAGDLIFLSLDADPLRNNTPIDATLALLDASGALLLQVNDPSSTSNTTAGAGTLTSLTPFSPGESLVFRAATAGTYYAVVAIGTTSAGAIGAGDYLLSITKQLRLSSAVSRKTHGGAGDFDIPLPLTGEPGVECRSSSGNHTLVFTFDNSIVSGNASVALGTGSVLGSPTFSANTMTVNLTGVADVQKVTVNLSGVTDSVAQVLPDTAVSMNLLIGDTNGNKSVSASDIGQTKAQSGIAVTAANFRQDVTPNGTINASDIGLVKSRSGQFVP